MKRTGWLGAGVMGSERRIEKASPAPASAIANAAPTRISSSTWPPEIRAPIARPISSAAAVNPAIRPPPRRSSPIQAATIAPSTQARTTRPRGKLVAKA